MDCGNSITQKITTLRSRDLRKQNIVAKIAGGASMFNFSDKSIISDIGKRNSDAVRKTLKDIGIPIVAEDTGGNKGRTMILEAGTGKVTLKIVGKGTVEL